MDLGTRAGLRRNRYPPGSHVAAGRHVLTRAPSAGRGACPSPTRGSGAPAVLLVRLSLPMSEKWHKWWPALPPCIRCGGAPVLYKNVDPGEPDEWLETEYRYQCADCKAYYKDRFPFAMRVLSQSHAHNVWWNNNDGDAWKREHYPRPSWYPEDAEWDDDDELEE